MSLCLPRVPSLHHNMARTPERGDPGCVVAVRYFPGEGDALGLGEALEPLRLSWARLAVEVYFAIFQTPLSFIRSTVRPMLGSTGWVLPFEVIDRVQMRTAEASLPLMSL